MKKPGFRLDRMVCQAWPIFLEAIRMRRTLTYTELAGRAGPPLNRRNLHRQLLIPLSQLCCQAGLPDLSALVVRKDTGLPGGGWWVGHGPAEDLAGAWAIALEECYIHAWPRAVPPALLAGASPEGTHPRR